MKRLTKTLNNLKRRKNRVRASVYGSAERPRLSVFVSNAHITAQLIDDDSHLTLAYITTVGQKSISGNMTEKAVWVGSEIAKKATSLKIKNVVFDRNGKLYHGRVKALADAARAAGLEF